MKNIFPLILFLFLLGCSQEKNEKSKLYRAGFKIVRTVDSSRIYKQGTKPSDLLHFRPVDLDIWYPAKINEKDSALVYRKILSLLEKRANYYTASDKWNGVTAQIAQSFCDGFKCSDTLHLLNYKTRSFKNAQPVDLKFPLVIYLCAYNGMSYENFSLFEELSAKGFVVVSVSSVGRYPGDMTMKEEDLLEQVNDALTAIKTLKTQPDIDFSQIGIIGYSWGGVAGAVLAGIVRHVSCLVLLDGSEFHRYGESKEEDSDFNGISNSSEFGNLKISVPYLRLESSPEAASGNADSIYNFSEKLSGVKLIFNIDSARHEDFSCLSAVVRE